jgi:hypothetical protein
VIKYVSIERRWQYYLKLSSGQFSDGIMQLIHFNSFARHRAMTPTRHMLKVETAEQIRELERADLIK